MKRNLEWNADCQNGHWRTLRDASHGLLSLFNKNADALHFSDQKFELVHQSSKLFSHNDVANSSSVGHLEKRCPEHAETALGSLDIA